MADLKTHHNGGEEKIDRGLIGDDSASGREAENSDQRIGP